MPDELVVASRTVPVAAALATILAPTTTAPVESVTVPVIWPVSVWPKANVEHNNNTQNSENKPTPQRRSGELSCNLIFTSASWFLNESSSLVEVIACRHTARPRSH